MKISVNLIMTMKRVDTANHKNKIVVNKNLKLFFKNEYCPYTWFSGGSVKQCIRKDTTPAEFSGLDGAEYYFC